MQRKILSEAEYIIENSFPPFLCVKIAKKYYE